MSNQKRHQAGAPASQGGQFASDPKPQADTALADPTQPFRDLGVTGQLRPAAGEIRYPPEGSQIMKSDAGHEIILFIQDGRLNAKTEFPGSEYSTYFHDDTSEDVIGDALHQAATADHISSLMEPKSRNYEVSGAYATVYSKNGALFTSVQLRSQHNWIEVSQYHDRDNIFVDVDNERLPDEDAKAFLAEAGEELMLEERTWQEMFHEAARRMVNDEDIKLFVREGAMRADDAAWAKIRA